MQHLEISSNYFSQNGSNGQDFAQRIAGQFYTHEFVGRKLAESVWAVAKNDLAQLDRIRIVDPFSGDGRLVQWLLEEALDRNDMRVKWEVELWDIDKNALSAAAQRLRELKEKYKDTIDIVKRNVDTFQHSTHCLCSFDIVITNPPWEILKPDKRELEVLSNSVRERYVNALKEYDAFITSAFKLSQPLRKFAGWGTNLARVGVEVAVRMAKPNRTVGIVSPASILADDNSTPLRRWLMCEHKLIQASYFPAEAKLYGRADIQSCILTLRTEKLGRMPPTLIKYDKCLELERIERPRLSEVFLNEQDFVIPLAFGVGAIKLLAKFHHLPRLRDLEGPDSSDLWAGREVDETRIRNWLGMGNGPKFIKGKMIDRYRITELPQSSFVKPDFRLPKSIEFDRIGWRDISRPNQKRRVKATIISKGWIAGNSIGVAYFRDSDGNRLKALLGVMNSFPFEFQLRSTLATGHVSLTSVRKVRVPVLSASVACSRLAELVERAMGGDEEAEPWIEATVAHLYGLDAKTLNAIICYFPKVTEVECNLILKRFQELGSIFNRTKNPASAHKEMGSPKKRKDEAYAEVRIPNHHCARLSELDVKTALNIPPGGNWKNVPESIPLKRLDTIRQSFARGEGSRSTYYGRLRPNLPSYTINTYYTRPGNGCHLHYDYEGGQHRVLSHREAARLQSFPDNFVFYGSNRRISEQIGNAVPPLLAYQIAKSLGDSGVFVDLFAGAGGLSLGFVWAGWKPIVANDIESWFLETHRANIDAPVLQGDIRNADTVNSIVEKGIEARQRYPRKKLWIVGGPPCQGFSTGGKVRSRDDERNHLVWNYKEILDRLKPDGFIFENVPGLLNMEKGAVFRDICDLLRENVSNFDSWVLGAEEYAVPQRRKRVFILGSNLPNRQFQPPTPITHLNPNDDLFAAKNSAISVIEALSDLPALKNGENGSEKDYTSTPGNAYQAFMRGEVSVEEYLNMVVSNCRRYVRT